MAFYEHRLFPWILEMTLRCAAVSELRRSILGAARPKVLELGFGTGLNLSHYPEHIVEITAVDLDSARPGFVRRRLETSTVAVQLETMDAAALAFPDGSFSTVVTTFFLCSVPDAMSVLQEIRRVLEPGGQHLFLEHGLSPKKWLRTWQNVVAPVTRCLGCGCQPNRPIDELVRGAGLALEQVRELDVPQLGRASGHVFVGRAVRT